MQVPGVALTSATRGPPNLAGGAEDLRRLRPLPWLPAMGDATRIPAESAWAVFYSVTILFLPGVYVLRALVHRRWSLR